MGGLMTGDTDCLCSWYRQCLSKNTHAIFNRRSVFAVLSLGIIMWLKPVPLFVTLEAQLYLCYSDVVCGYNFS